MLISSKVNDKQVIKIPKKYFQCFKLNESSYALFDIKMDMPIVIGSLAIIKSVKLPQNSTVFLYKINSKNFFEKPVEKTIEINGEGVHQKPPLRYNYIDDKTIFYHYFKLSPVLCVIFGEDFKMPIAYGSNQKIQAVINSIPKNSTIFYYKEDFTVKNSFKFYMVFDGRK